MGRKRKKRVPGHAGTQKSVSKLVKDPTPAPTMESRPTWQLSLVQAGGPFGWQELSRQKLLEVLEKLKGFERMTWGEIQQKAKNYHSVEISSLAPRAQQELVKLRLTDTLKLYSIRLSGEERVWGVKAGAVVRLLWWDPSHEVCPSVLKHT